jgi:DNA invertase Pin-like site-specific DNA recombinase
MSLEAAVYVRTYPRTEIAERNTTEARIQRCLQAATQRGYTVADEHIYQDIAIGLNVKRKGLEQLLEQMRAKAFAALFVDTLSQLSRDPSELSHILQMAEDCHVTVYALSS